MTFLATLIIGIVAGSRSMMAPAAVAWAAWLGWIDLAPTWASFMASLWAVLLFTLLALVELVTDQLPTTPGRKVPVQFGGRIVSGAFCGAALGAAAGATLLGLVLGGELRARLAASFGSDRPAALIEDAGAFVLALVAVSVA